MELRERRSSHPCQSGIYRHRLRSVLPLRRRQLDLPRRARWPRDPQHHLRSFQPPVDLPPDAGRLRHPAIIRRLGWRSDRLHRPDDNAWNQLRLEDDVDQAGTRPVWLRQRGTDREWLVGLHRRMALQAQNRQSGLKTWCYFAAIDRCPTQAFCWLEWGSFAPPSPPIQMIGREISGSKRRAGKKLPSPQHRLKAKQFSRPTLLRKSPRETWSTSRSQCL